MTALKKRGESMAIKRPRSIRGMITREITSTIAVIRCYDDFNHIERDQTITISGKCVNDAMLMDIARKSGSLEMGLIPLGVRSKEIKTELRAMSIENFMKYSEIIDTETETDAS